MPYTISLNLVLRQNIKNYMCMGSDSNQILRAIFMISFHHRILKVFGQNMPVHSSVPLHTCVVSIVNILPFANMKVSLINLQKNLQIIQTFQSARLQHPHFCFPCYSLATHKTRHIRHLWISTFLLKIEKWTTPIQS